VYELSNIHICNATIDRVSTRQSVCSNWCRPLDGPETWVYTGILGLSTAKREVSTFAMRQYGYKRVCSSREGFGVQAAMFVASVRDSAFT